MQNQVYERCRKLFREAKALPPDEWPQFIHERCHGNRDLEAKLAGLLDALRNPDPLSPLNVDPFEIPVPKRIGDWEVIGELGQGGSGCVYRARRVGAPAGGIVALKVVRSDRVTADAIARFANERKLLKSVRHNNIARILDSGETSNRLPFYVMEYVDGVSIAEHCRRLRLTIRQRAQLFQQVCTAVHFLHDYGILHRDITPNNLLVMRDGFLKVVDFGISKSFDMRVKTTGTPSSWDRMMTPAYASPEQLAEKPMSRQSDIYSMGVVLYELLTGALPHDPIQDIHRETAKPYKYQKMIKASERVAAHRARPLGCPETSEQALKLLRGSLDNILSMTLHKNPHSRYATAELFRIDLARHLDGLDTLAGRSKRAFFNLVFSRH